MKTKLLSTTAALLGLLPSMQAAIPLGAVQTFDALPVVADWSTVSIAGGGADITTTGAMDTRVQTLTAASINTVLGSSATVPPSTAAIARWNSTGLYVQTRPTGNAAIALLATIENSSGGDVTSLAIDYDFGVPGPVASEDPGLAGWRVYFSMTGAADSWVLIPELTTATPGHLSAIISLGTFWEAGQMMYVLFIDDNGNGGTDGSFSGDNFRFAPGVSGVSILSPADGSSFVDGSAVPVTVSASPDVSEVRFLIDGAVVATDDTPPFAISVPGLALGDHTVAIEGISGADILTAGPNNFSIRPNQLPTLSFTSPLGNPSFLVGTPVTNTIAVADSDGTIARVVWSIDGAPKFTNTGGVFIYESSLAGDHVVTATATDNNGGTVEASVNFSVINPFTPPYHPLITNGSDWRYYNTSNMPPADGNETAWNQPGYDDEQWAIGMGQFGNGDDGEGRPKRTPIDIGAGTRYITTYYRRTFEAADPGLFTNLVLRLEVDDGAVVYINGIEVARYNMPAAPAVIDYATLAPAAEAGDGRFFVNLNIDLVNGPAGNPLEEINTIAVEVHQSSATSSDLSFDLQLWGEESRTSEGLAISNDGSGNVVITWDPLAYEGFTLQSTDKLDSDPTLTVWTAVPAGPGRAVVPTTTPVQFFRLRRP